jgi:DNA-binding transcriptional ArsR family regulator
MLPMPLLTTNIRAVAFEEIKTLVGKGLYASPEQFLEIAAFNQLALERGAKPADLPVRSRHQKEGNPKTTSAASDLSTEHRRHRQKSHRRATKVRPELVSENSMSATLKKFSVDTLSRLRVEPVPTEPRAQNERLWGQVNRLFPIKLACRWIAVASAEAGSWLSYDAISDGLVRDAASLGSNLSTFDATAQRKRDELLATGLPRKANLASHDRFLSQYIARTTRAGDIYPGAICQYALAVFHGDQLGLTKAGLALAHFVNPVLDLEPHSAISKLSDGNTTTLSNQERLFLIEQVINFVPGELHDLTIVLEAIFAGHATPDDLLTAVGRHLPREWSPMMTRTHVSGVVARLTEMGLIRRKWEGRNTRYEQTPLSARLAREESRVDR